MKFFFLLLFSFFSWQAHSASCCVANTSVPNLMILPSTWQQTFTVSSVRVIGDVDPKGKSTFRNSKNRETTNLARMDLAYSWTEKYQNGVSFRYQNKKRAFDGTDASDSGWSDLGLFQAYQPIKYQRTWIFNSTNIPTSNSVYDSQETFSVDAHGTGTYQTGLGIFHLVNFKSWDMVLSSEVHHSFARSFGNGQDQKEIGSFWGTSVSAGVGYIPWRSKMRYGLNLIPRLEGQKTVTINDEKQNSKQSLVWDTAFNVTYTINASYAVGVNYLDQTIFGPARNTLLNRSLSVLFQSHFL
jgi:hypothetical protein